LTEESASAQQHFLDLCTLIGHPTPAEADPTGQSFTFEAGATRFTAVRAVPTFGRKAALRGSTKASTRISTSVPAIAPVREALENPPLLIVSDTDQIIIHTNFTNTIKRTYPIALDELVKPESLTLLRNAFNHPDVLRVPVTPAK